MSFMLSESSDKSINIAYIVICHDQPNLLQRLGKKLKFENDKIFVHVDKKVDISPFEDATKNLENVILIKNRIKNYWGGFHSIIATMELIRAVLNDTIKYDRIVLLQGKDYPLYSPVEIHNFFKEKPFDEFCQAKNISVSSIPKDYMKCCGYWFMDCNSNIFTKVFKYVLSILNTKICIKYRKSKFNNHGTAWNIYKGWAQFAITFECAQYILNVYDNNHKYNRYMKHRFPPDEIYIHTIIHNSQFAEHISKYNISERKQKDNKKLGNLNLTYFEYPKNVTIFQNEEDLESLRETGALFIRKVMLPESENLLNKIDNS